MLCVILNIKGDCCKSYTSKTKDDWVDVEGPAEVTAGDILTDSDIEECKP